MITIILVIIEIMTTTFEKTDDNIVTDLSMWFATFALQGKSQHHG